MKKGYYLLKTDGSMHSSGRRAHDDPPGQAGIGVVLKTPRDAPVETISEAIGPATNDVAEYQALIEGLKLARSLGINYLRAYMDSEFIVEQVNDRSDVHEPDLKPLYEEVRALCSQFGSIRISWIPREWNKEADALATLARESSNRSTP